MKNVKKVVAIFILFTVLIACNTKNKEEYKEHKNKEAVFYTCSMDPQIKEDKPGKCPICHMQLISIKNKESTANEISLSEQQIELGHIRTQLIKVSEGNLEQNYNGVLSMNQDKINTISARAMGRVEHLYFKTIGDYVKKNTPLYQLYSEDIAVAKQDYFTAYQQLTIPGEFGKNAKAIFRAAQQKLLFFGLSNTQIQSIKTGEVSPYTTFYSTQNGIISKILSAEGSNVMEGSEILTVTDLSTLWLETQVNVTFLNSLKIGQKALVSYPDFPGKTSQAKITFINPEINPNTRLIVIRLEVSNQDLQLKPGMQAIAKVQQSPIKGLFLPIDAVIQEQDMSHIWVEKTPGVFASQGVETGVETNGRIEIISEIDPSQKVVITGAYAIDSEYKLRKTSEPMGGMKME